MCQPIARILLALFLVIGANHAARGEELSEGIELFEKCIRPVLVESCFECHSAGAEQIEGELTLDNRAAVRRGGRTGSVITPGAPTKSRLFRALQYDDPGLQMPPEGKLSAEVIAGFRRWIELGAPDPRDGSAVSIETIASRAESHWAFQPPVRPQLPDNDGATWPANSLDQLILAELTSAGLSPSPTASRGELIRRLYFDLIGLPPSWEEVQEFAANDSPRAYRELVDKLLDSPQFGERWARHWLDVSRFADTKGYVFTADRNFPCAYKYRDWVIRAFNDDMPIDRFLMYQIAADQMVTDDERHHLAAQGYVTLGRRFINNAHDIIADRIDVIFRGMMGLTAACARCHDHKFDPITDEDYYAVYGMFASSEEVQDEDLPLRLVDKATPQDVGVFLRGNAHNRGQPVPRGFPKFFTDSALPIAAGSGRMQLAEAIAHPQNPLTARVFVNRVWGHLFGEPLVGTASDFGLRSEVPRQQAVLDWLATDFASNHWSLKWLVRELVTSSTYRQSSQTDPALLTTDPENQLWGRMNRRRLDFEALRDGLLAVSLRLDRQVGGESERIDTEQGGRRRTLYAHIDRQNLPGLFRAFDFASPDAHSPQRPHTLVPQQPLFLLNSPMVQLVAHDLVSSLSTAEPTERIGELYRRVLAREPSASETDRALKFLDRHEPEPLRNDEWSFGYGHLRFVDDRAMVQLEPLNHFVSNRWQANSEYPEKQFGHLSVTPDGGHPGDQVDCCSIRRWTAPERGKLLITGELSRPSEQGDGVEAFIVSSRRGVIANWIVEQGSQPTPAELPVVESNESVDFVVGCRGNAGWDSFHWKVSLALESASGWQHWSSQRDFRGPQPEPLDLWSQLAQVLLVSNEFLFVD